jgi:hypothetical protein
LKKLNRFLSQRLYEKGVKIGKGTDQMNKVSCIRRREFAVAHAVDSLTVDSIPVVQNLAAPETNADFARTESTP